MINNMATHMCFFVFGCLEIWGGGRPVFVSPSLLTLRCSKMCRDTGVCVTQSIHVKLTLLTAQIWVNYP